MAVCPTFTERMEFIESRRVRFNHASPNGERERAGADGTDALTPHGEKTQLEVDIALTIKQRRE